MYFQILKNKLFQIIAYQVKLLQQNLMKIKMNLFSKLSVGTLLMRVAFDISSIFPDLFCNLSITQLHYTTGIQRFNIRSIRFPLSILLLSRTILFLNRYQNLSKYKCLPVYYSTTWAVSRMFFISFGCHVFMKIQFF